MKPAISLVDAVVGMEGDGPSGGVPRAFGFVAASEDPFLLDRVMCHVLGLLPTDALTVDASIRMGLAPLDVSKLEVDDETGLFASPLSDLVLPRSKGVSFLERIPHIFKFTRPVFERLFAAKPVIKADSCIGCGRCEEACPRRAIAIKDGKAVIDRKECILCFCCHEVCPQRAIDIKKRFER